MGLQEHEIGCGLFTGERACTCMFWGNCVECGWRKFRVATSTCIDCGGKRRIIHGDMPEVQGTRENV